VSTEEQRIERRNAEWRRDAELGHISVHRFRTLLADVERLTEERDALAARDARVRALLAARPDGEDVVRVTIRPIPSVGIGEVTGTYVSQHALRRAFDGDA